MASRLARIRLLDELARFISTVMSPLLTPTYGLFMALSISPKVLDTTGSRMKLLLIVLALLVCSPWSPLLCFTTSS
ncbi:MAG: hypothetical protein IIU17_03470 [Muribaculaceae bacterium]|nr:hypothetical protein [Muribaculaceae bacterium]